MDEQPGFVVRRIPPDREVVLDWLVRATRRYPVHGLVEMDVGEARALIEQAAGAVSWTGFVIASVGRAVARHPEVNARRAGSRIVQLTGVDVGATVERHVGGEVVLDAVAVRGADTASCAEVTERLRRAKAAGAGPARSGWATQVTRLPGPVRRTVFRVAGTRPRIAATYGPPVGVTSIGMFSRGWGWAVPIPPLTLIVTVGGVADRAVVRDGQVVARPLLPLTVSFDHAVVDGAPATRFVETLRELIESAAVLREDA